MSVLARNSIVLGSSAAKLCCRVSVTRHSSKRISPDRFPSPELKAGVQFESRVYSRKKEAKRKAETATKSLKPEFPDEQLRSVPDIEGFAYDNVTNSARLSKPEASAKLLPDEKTNDASSKARGAPVNWGEILEGIRGMRSTDDAPVDSMGRERAGSFLPAKDCHLSASGKKILNLGGCITVKPNQGRSYTSIAEAVQRLCHNGLLVPDAIARADEATIKSTIYPVGFYSRKAGYMKRIAEICLTKYGGDIPTSLEELLSLPGIGPKMAHLIMHCAWDNVQGICVDTHVHRICNRLGWVSRAGTQQRTSSPEETRVSLQSWLPREEWVAINRLLVGFGRTVCTPVRPRCGQCSVNNLCPSAFKEIPSRLSKPNKSSRSKAF